MSWQVRLINAFLRLIFDLVCRIDVAELKKLPTAGPMIIVGNHINFLEIPVVVPRTDTSLFTGIAKQESWKNPLFKFLFNHWEVIPLNRDEVDREAFQQMLGVLNQGKILVLFPEGTRSKTGQMLQGRPGIFMLAMKSGASILPIGFHGYEHFWDNLKRLRKTDFHIRIGTPFRIDLNGDAPSRDVRQAVTDEIMYKIAELLPDRYRGYYQYQDRVDYRYAIAE